MNRFPDTIDVVVKQRPIWQMGGMRLLRETYWARYATQTVPASVNGMRILFPQTTAIRSWRVTCTTRRLPGIPLLELLYRPQQRTAVIDIGMTVLTALHDAQVQTRSETTFSWVFRWGKGLRLLTRTFLDSQSLSTPEKQELRRLVRRYISRRTKRPVLVHGDLHASHVLVATEQKTLGIIDLEAMHVGKAATNFAQLWDGYHYADATLGRDLYERYVQYFGVKDDDHFDNDIRLEMVLRSYDHIRAGERTGNRTLAEKAMALLHNALSGLSVRTLYDEDKLR